MNKKSEIGISVVLILVIITLTLGYLGFIPLFGFLGSNTPKELGVRYTISDTESATLKLGITLNSNQPNHYPTIELKNLKPVKTSLNSAEITALFNLFAERWKDCPIEKVQVLIHQDGTFEMSGIFMADRYMGFAEAVKLPEPYRSQIRASLVLIKANPAFYIKGTFSITNGVALTNFSEFQLGDASMPISIIQTTLNNFVQRLCFIKNLSLGDSLINIEGKIPTEIELTSP